MTLKPGDQYGTLRIAEVLGEGGFARVYKVFAPGSDQPMALKLTPEPVRTTDQAQRVLREVSVLRKLDNPWVVTVHDAGIDRKGYAYIVMDIAEGWALSQIHDFERPVRHDFAATVLWQVCKGLGQAHQLGIVHRDVKPDNIVLDAEYRVKVVDFGFARSWNDGTLVGRGPTMANTLVGTPHYAQPEQLVNPSLTPAADVYSVAMIGYELLTAYTPFVADQTVNQLRDAWRDDVIQWLKAHAQMEVIPIARRPGTSQVPAALASAIERALAKEPTQRPPDGAALAREIHRAVWGTDG